MMTERSERTKQCVAAIVWFVVAISGSTYPATAIALDWAKVPEHQLTLFYPGQASWEWALTERDHRGGPKIREGKSCKGCHDGEQADIGASIVANNKLEPTPISGKPSSLMLKVQVARDAERLYFRLRWKGAPATGHKQDPEFAARATVMLGDAQVKEAVRAGCWGSCHDDATGMASAAPDGEISKYLTASRMKVSRQGGGENYKSASELQALLQQGAFLEYWQAQLSPGQPARAGSGHILDKRSADTTPSTKAEANYANGEWAVVLSRPLKAAGTGQKDLVAGKSFAVGFAIHDDFANHRFHFVSLEESLALDGSNADLVANSK